MKILFSFDVEGSLHKYIHSPYVWHSQSSVNGNNTYVYSGKHSTALKNFLKWKLNLAKNKFTYAESNQGFLNLQQFFKKEQISVSFALSGHLYLNECKAFPHFSEIKPKAFWSINKLKKDWYYWDKASSSKQKPGFYYGNIIQKNKNFDFGIHGFAHEALPLENKDTINSIIQSSINAAKKHKITISHLVPPFNMSQNIDDPQKLYDCLIQNKILAVRTAGHDNFFSKFQHTREVKPILEYKNLKIIHLSNAIEGYFNEETLNKTISDVTNHAESKESKKLVYCFAGHDYTFKTTKSLSSLVSQIRKLKENYSIEFTNFSKL